MKTPKMILCVFLAGAVLCPAIQGQTSLSLSPVQFDLSIAAGQSSKQTLVIGNDTYGTVRIQADVGDWTIGNVGSDVFPAGDATGFSCRDWMRVEEPEFLLKPGQHRSVSLRFVVPSSAVPGQYLAAVSFMSMAGDASINHSSVMIQGQLVAVVFITVGAPRTKGSVADLTVEKKEGRNVVIVRAKNSGRTFLEASGKIELRNAKGKKIITVDIPEDLVPPLSERLLPVVLEKDIPPGIYQVRCLLRLPSRKTLEMKKSLEIR